MAICQICSFEPLYPIIALGHQPPSDAFISPERKHESFNVYPLDVFFCTNCKLVQLGYMVDPEILFRDYVYNTRTNAATCDNFMELAKSVTKKYKLKNEDLVVDIGSNDGTLLEFFKSQGAQVLGIDPSSTAKIAIDNGIPTIIDFFNKKTAQYVVDKYKRPKIITAMNVFAHVKELDSFMRGISMLLDDQGIFISESHYLLDMIEKLQYDAIYHEHLRYYSIKPLIYLFSKYNMEVFYVERIPSHGGSLRVYAAKSGAYDRDGSVQELIQTEERAGLHLQETYDRFAHRIVESKHRLLELILQIKKKGYEIVGIGAPAKGNTFLNFCQIREDLITYLAEHSKLKIGLLAPGSLIPVLDEEKIFQEQPPYALLLSWNLKNIIVSKLLAKGYRGKLIIPGEKPIIE